MNTEQIKAELEKIPNGHKIVALNKSRFFALDFLTHWTFFVGYAIFFATMCIIGYGAIKNKNALKECDARIAVLEKTIEQVNGQTNAFEIVEE